MFILYETHHKQHNINFMTVNLLVLLGKMHFLLFPKFAQLSTLAQQKKCDFMYYRVQWVHNKKLVFLVYDQSQI